jgi:hypothetical protein
VRESDTSVRESDTSVRESDAVRFVGAMYAGGPGTGKTTTDAR